MKEALFYKRDGDEVICGLCLHQCRIKSGRRGICGVRENRSGTLYSLVYGKVSARQIDPVEKKPLFHFLPGSLTYSVATGGCNFTCLHCQNHSLSQVNYGREPLQFVAQTPEEVARAAKRGGCRSVSYTYVEPTVFFEFAYECCLAARALGLKNIFVSNGYMSTEAARMLAPVLDGINIDIKSSRDRFYQEVCGAHVQQVLDNVHFFHSKGVWVEVTTLVIPGLNDSDEELAEIADFIVSVDPHIGWHVSGFRPMYKMVDRPPTHPSQLLHARKIGFEAGVRHVYIGNVHDGSGENTMCPECSNLLIQRRGFSVIHNEMIRGGCPACGYQLPGVWLDTS